MPASRRHSSAPSRATKTAVAPPPHPATVVQPKAAIAGRPSASRPHPATVQRARTAQPKTAVAPPPHPATVVRQGSAAPRQPRALIAQSATENKQQRQSKKSHVLTWVAEYAKKQKMTDACFNHIFLGQPLDGSNPDLARPTGFHAYTDAGGAPAGIHIIRTIGNPNKFHKVNWRYTTSAGTVSKESSMFPRNLPRKKVIALILMNSQDAWNNAPNPFPPRTPAGKVVTSQMLSDVFGLLQAWSLHSPGDTIYPTSP